MCIARVDNKNVGTKVEKNVCVYMHSTHLSLPENVRRYFYDDQDLNDTAVARVAPPSP